MRVYIEVVLFDNFIIDCVLLYLSLKCARVRVRWYLVLLGGVLGALTAAALPLLENAAKWAVIPAKLASSLLIVGSAARYPGVKRYFLTLLLFYLATMLLGGACFGLFALFGVSESWEAVFYYGSEIPVGFVVGGVFFGILAVKFLIEYIARRRTVTQCLVEGELELAASRVPFTGFLDTGNRFYDDVTGYPVVLADFETAERLLAGDETRRKKGHYARFSTASGACEKIFVFKPDKLLYYYADKVHIVEEVMVGISFSSSFGREGYSVLLHGSMLP